jgi:lysophospholipase L1-like esterase
MTNHPDTTASLDHRWSSHRAPSSSSSMSSPPASASSLLWSSLWSSLAAVFGFLFAPRWKVVFWACGVYGFALAAVTALDFGVVACLLALFLALGLHAAFGVATVGLATAIGRDDRWHIPGWLLGTAAGIATVSVINSFALGTVMHDGWFERVYPYLAVGSVLAGGASAALRTRLRRPQLHDWAWTMLAGLTGVVLGLGLFIGALANAANHRQRDVDDQVPVIPTVTGISGRYVALGDSYSAGEGLGPYQPGSDACHRSTFAYPMLLTFGEPVEVDFRACSGAVTEDVDLGVVGGYEPQIPAGIDDSVALVTISIGGNDVVFADIVEHCFLYEHCLDKEFHPRDPHPGRPTIRYPSDQPLRSWAVEALAIVADNVARVYDRIGTAYPNARIVVVGYPYLFPSGAAPWDQSDCGSVLRRVDAGERDELRALGAALNQRLYQTAFAHGVEFISPAGAWDDHEPCGTRGQYTNAVRPGSRLWNPIDGGTLHPNRRGQQQLARLVACYLNTHPEPPIVATEFPPGAVENPLTCS